MPTPDQANGCCYCFVEEGGERTFVCDHGAEYLFYKEWFDTLKMEKVSSIYICGLEIEDKTGGTIVDFLEANSSIPLFFAPGPRICFIERTLVDRIFALHPIVHLNEDELCGFTGATALEEGAKALYALTENMVIVTHGAEGAYYYDGDEFIHVPPVKAVKVVDTIGAGDSHIGTVMACLAKGRTPYEAIKTANAVSSLVVGKKGATLSKDELTITI